MATEAERIIEHLRRLTLHDAGIGDGRLLERFTLHKDEAAFEALVRRHGPMVLGVCRRIVGNYHDAEDAFQATFLVLVRKSASVTPKETIANWLYGVAFRTALKAKTQNAKRHARDQRAARLSSAPAGPHDFPGELQSVLDQELNRLSEKHRAAFVLCDLEGKTHKEAARQLGCPEGTLSVRLMRAKKLLAKRLSGRGFGPSVGSLSILASADAASASVPPTLMTSTVKAATVFAAGQVATGLISAEVTALTQGVLNAMLLTKLKIASAIIMVAGIAGLGIHPLIEVLRAGGADDQTAIKQVAQAADAVAKRVTDFEKIQGSWQVIALQRKEDFADNNEIKEMKTVFKGNAVTFFEGGKIKDQFTFVLDSTKSPRAIDLTKPSEGNVTTVQAIYQVHDDDDTLALAIGSPTHRPVGFGGGKDVTIAFQWLPDDGKTDLDRIQGAWQESEDYKNLTYIFRGNKLTKIDRAGISESGTFTLDPAKSPKAIDITITDRRGNDATFHGIYEFGRETFSLGIIGVNDSIKFNRVTDVRKQPTPPVVVGKARIDALMSERLDALRSLVNIQGRNLNRGVLKVETFMETQRLLLAAELETCTTEAERVACYQRTLARLQPVKEIHDAKFNAGTIGREPYYSFTAFHLEIEIAYERAKMKAAVAPK